MDSQSTSVVFAAKLPILNPNEFDIWKMRIEQYFLMTDYSLWEVIINGDSPIPSVFVEGAAAPTVILTAEQKLARRNELKARGTLLMALPDKHRLKFNSHKDAKTLMHAIEKRFGGNTETKKVQNTLLKQQFENFTGSSSKDLDQIHDRLQKLVSQLEIHEVSLSQEDVNLKFLRSLPSEWKTHTLIWRNKANLEEHSLDDLFNISAATSVSAVCVKLHVSSHLNIDSLSNAIDVDDLEEIDLRWQMAMLTMRARRFLQKTGRNLGDNRATTMGFDMSKVECYNCHIKRHFAQECRSPKDTRRTVVTEPQRRHVPEEPANFALMAISSTSSFDNEVQSCSTSCSKAYKQLHSQYDSQTAEICKSKIDVLSYQAALESVESRLVVYKQNELIFQDNIVVLKNEVTARDNFISNLKQKLKEAETERDDLKLKFEKFQSSSKSLAELIASQTNNKHGLGYLPSEGVSASLSLSCPSDRVQPSRGYNVVPPPITGNFMPPKPDLVFKTALLVVESDHSAFNVQLSLAKPAQPMSHTTESMAPIIEDWPIEAPILDDTPKPTSSKTNGSRKRKNKKTCFVCKGVDHLIKDCNFHTKPKSQPTPRNSAYRGYDKQYASSTKKYTQKHRVPTVVFTKSKPVSVTAARPVSAAIPKIMAIKPRHNRSLHTNPNSIIRRHKTRSKFSKTSNSSLKVTAANANIVSAAKCKKGKWVWRPKQHILDHDSSASKLLKRLDHGNPQHTLKDKGVIDSGCSRHMIKNMSYLSDFQELNDGYVAFGGNLKGGKIAGKGKIKTGKLDFEYVYFVKELKFNLFSVSQICDKKNKVLFTDSKCLVLSPDFKLSDENQVLLRVPRENNMYNVNLKDIVPFRDLTCLFTKATINESNLWHRRLGHVNFKTNNKLVKGNLVRGLPIKVFENPNTCVACMKGKQYRASCKTKLAKAVNTACYVQNRVLVTKPQNKTPYELLHGRTPSTSFMRPFGCPVTILNTLDSLGKFKGNVDEGLLVGYSVNSKAFRVFNSQTRIVQETLHVNFLEHKPNVVGTGPTWLFDIDSLTRTMNYQLVTAGNQSNSSAGDATFDGKEHDAEKPESAVNLSPSSSALSGEQDDMTKKKDKGKSPVDYLTGNRDFNAVFDNFSEDSSNDVSAASLIVSTAGLNYSNSTNSISAVGPIVPAAEHNYSNSTNPISGAGPSNSNSSPTHGQSSLKDTYLPPYMVKRDDIVYSDHENVGAEADFNNLETSITVSPIPTTRTHNAHPISQIIGNLSSTNQTRSMTRVIRDQGGILQILNEDFHTCMFACLLLQEEHKRVHQALKDLSYIKTIQEELLQFKMQKVWILVDLPHRKRAIGHTQEEGIDYEELFASVARIKAIRLFLTYAFIMGFMVYQMDVKSAFLYGTIEDEVYVCQPPGFEDPDHPDKVYKVVKALYGLHQAPRAWYETLAHYLLKNRFHRGQINQTLFIKKQKGDILLVQIYVDDIIFDATNKDLCKSFEKLMKDKFQISSIGELTFFLGLQFKQNKDGIFINQDKYVAEILKKFGLTEGKSATTPIDTEKPLLKNPDGEDVDVHIYRSMIGLWYPKDSPFDLVAYSDSDYAGASLDRKSTTGGCQFLGSRLISWQCKKQTVIATSSIEAEYIAGASCYAQVLWIQNQMLDYGLQALVDKKRVVVTEAAIRDALHLDDAEGVDCLPNEEIFIELARMGYEKPTTKLTFYKAFFSSQRVGKGCSGVETPLFEGMLATREPEDQGNIEKQVDEEEQGNDNNAAEEPVTAVGDVTGQSTQSPTPLTPPPQQPQDIPSTSQVQLPPPQQQSPPPAQPQGAHFPMSLLQEALDACAALTRRVEHLEHDKVAQDLEIIKLKIRGRITEESDKDEGAKVVNEEEETEEVRDNAADAKVKGRQADVYRINMDHAAKLLSMQEEEEPEVHEAVEVVTTAKLITEVVAVVSGTVSAAAVILAPVTAATISSAPVKVVVPATKRRRGVIIKDPEEESSTNTPAETKLKDKGKAKSKKLNKEAKYVEELKQHLEIVPDEDDDVFTEATPLARKVPVVDYQIIHVDNKPRYKIIRADDTHQLYRSFITMLKNFDREDLETLWNIVKERFSTSKPNNFSDEYFLSTLKTMFGRPDGQDNVWKDQRSAYGQALVKSWKLLISCRVHIISFTTIKIILLVERRYPLLKFTLEQMINVVRLQVKEQSEMSLELIRFTRQQLQEEEDCWVIIYINPLNLSTNSFGVDAAMELKEKHQVFTVASDDISAARHKLMLLDTAAD
nr:hypothetical protein [Tanacetum cinerariifolium]